MNLGLIKGGFQILTGVGVGMIVDNTLKYFKPRDVKGFKKVAVTVGGVVLSAWVSEKASTYAGEMFDNVVEVVSKGKVKPQVKITEEMVEESTAKK